MAERVLEKVERLIKENKTDEALKILEATYEHDKALRILEGAEKTVKGIPKLLEEKEEEWKSLKGVKTEEAEKRRKELEKELDELMAEEREKRKPKPKPAEEPPKPEPEEKPVITEEIKDKAEEYKRKLLAEEVIEEIDKAEKTVSSELEKIDRESKILENKDLFYKTRKGKGLKSLIGLRDWVAGIANRILFDHFLRDNRLVEWVEKELEEKEVADEIRKILAPLQKRRDEWFETIKREDLPDFIKYFIKSLLEDKRLERKFRPALLGIINKRVKAVEKAVKDKEEELKKKQKKIEEEVEDTGSKAQQIIERLKKIEEIEKEVDTRTNYMNEIINWIHERIPTIKESTNINQRIEQWKKIKEVMDKLPDHRKAVALSFTAFSTAFTLLLIIPRSAGLNFLSSLLSSRSDLIKFI
jgi:hypothetical protein